MNDQKRFFIFILITIGLFYLYTTYFVPKKEPVPSSAQRTLETTLTVNESIDQAESSLRSEKKTDVKEEIVTLESNVMRLDLSNKGAVIQNVLLKQSDLILDKPQELVDLQNTMVQPFFISRFGAHDFSGNEVFKITEKREDLVEFTTEIIDNVLLKKRIRLDVEKYEIRLELEVENLSEKIFNVSRGIDLVCGSILPTSKREGIRNIEIDTLFTETSQNFRKKLIRKIKEREVASGAVLWTAMKNKYFAVILDPDEDGMGVVYDFVTDEELKEGQRHPEKYYYNALRMDPFALDAGQKRTFSFSYFAGPKEYNLLSSYKRGYEELMGFRGPFGYLIKMLLTMMVWLFGVFHNYGIAIILISVITKVLFYPLTQKSFKSMQQMQAIQPLVTGLRDQYKDNPKKLQQETMALYKKYKVNPLGGCLPLLFQMPIFFALFRMLTGAVQLRGADFLWIKDLTAPDTIMKISGFSVNILPLVMGLFMFIQQKMTPTTDPNQKKMVMFMPVIFTVIFYNMPSGLVLYWLVNNILTIIQQYHIKKQGSVTLAEEDAQIVSN